MESTGSRGFTNSYREDIEVFQDPLSSRNITVDEPQDEDMHSKFTDVSVEDHPPVKKSYTVLDTTKTVSDLAQVIYESSTSPRKSIQISKQTLGNTAFVANAQIISNMLTGYVEYTINVRVIQGRDAKGHFENIRRFSDFDRLRELLVMRWPGCYIPSLPQKQVIGNTDEAFVEHRRKHLETFLSAAINLHYICETEEFLQFIRGPRNYREAVKHMTRPSFPVILGAYLSSFAAYSSIVVTDGMRERINDYYERFRSASNLLSNLDEIFRNISNNFRSYKSYLVEMLQLQHEFESTYLRQYKNEIRSSFSIQKSETIIEDADPLYGFRAWVESEQFEFSAMMQAMKARAGLLEWKETLSQRLIDMNESKVSKMKEWMTRIKNINTNDGYDTEERIQEALEAIDKIEVIVSSRILNYEIPVFKQERKQSFTMSMQKLYSIVGSESNKVMSIATEILQKFD